MSDNPSDTKPKSPFKEDTRPFAPITSEPPIESGDTEPTGINATAPQEPVWQVDQFGMGAAPSGDDQAGSGGSGCWLQSCIGLVAVGFAVVIVLLAGAAGWTVGLREAGVNATATRSAEINEQLNRLPEDIAGGNIQLIDARLRWLVTNAPDLVELPDLQTTATAVFIDSLPTATPSLAPSQPPSATPTETGVPTQMVEAAEAEITLEADGGFDLDSLLAEAQRNVETGQFEDAYELLEAISGIDDDFQPQLVRQLTTTALNGQARAFFNTNQPAQGIYWASIAESLGVMEGDVSVELYAATLFLDAKSAVGVNYPEAIADLRQLVNLGQGRYYVEAVQLLFEQYVGYGDAWAAEGEYCPAFQQYSAALSVQSSTSVVGKRDNAEDICSRATPVPGPGVTPGAPGETAEPVPPASGQVAPVGQPG